MATRQIFCRSCNFTEAQGTCVRVMCDCDCVWKRRTDAMLRSTWIVGGACAETTPLPADKTPKTRALACDLLYNTAHASPCAFPDLPQALHACQMSPPRALSRVFCYSCRFCLIVYAFFRHGPWWIGPRELLQLY